MNILQNNIDDLEKLTKIGIKTFGVQLWKPELHTLKLLQKELNEQ